RRYAYGSSFMSPIETAAASRRLVPPTTWTARPMAPGLASAPPPRLFGAIPSRVAFPQSPTRRNEVKSPHTFFAPGITAWRRWPRGKAGRKALIALVFLAAIRFHSADPKETILPTPHAPLPLLPADPARDPEGSGGRLPPADVARGPHPPRGRRDLRLAAAR